jgi:hypothetical protein
MQTLARMQALKRTHERKHTARARALTCEAVRESARDVLRLIAIGRCKQTHRTANPKAAGWVLRTGYKPPRVTAVTAPLIRLRSSLASALAGHADA